MSLIFVFVSLLVPLLLYILLPRLLTRLRPSGTDRRWLLALACSLFFISWYLPSPLIDGEDTAFITHFVGGGIFSGLLWLYATTYLGTPRRLLTDIVSLFALVSSLGVLNELFELGLRLTILPQLSLADTSWDLLANTLGAAAFFAAYTLVHWRRATLAD